MATYEVWQERTYVFFQEVEAESEAQALELAQERGEWEQDINDIQEETTARIKEEK
jgi:hypothetical protein